MSATSNLSISPQTDTARVSAAKPVTPLCFVVDEDPKIRHFLSLILQGAGVGAIEYSDCLNFRVERLGRPVYMVFLKVGLDTNDGVKTLEGLAKARSAGAV